MREFLAAAFLSSERGETESGKVLHSAMTLSGNSAIER
jgi:hypothetical protein